MAEVATTEWFKNWFDSPYYDILYKDRDQQEADLFIHNLVDFLKPAPNCQILDLACGKGRHAISLSKMGFYVTGIDLSERNIKAAQKSESHNLSFYIHDMRKPYMVNYYDIVLNLFTSFGYFDKERENNQALKSVFDSLKPGGLFILDFVNVERVCEHLTGNEKKTIDGITFNINKSTKDNFIVKDINVADGANKFSFEEKVHMYSAPKLQLIVEKQGFEIVQVFGDYDLSSFNIKNSERFIIIGRKK